MKKVRLLKCKYGSQAAQNGDGVTVLGKSFSIQRQIAIIRVGGISESDGVTSSPNFLPRASRVVTFRWLGCIKALVAFTSSSSPIIYRQVVIHNDKYSSESGAAGGVDDWILHKHRLRGRRIFCLADWGVNKTRLTFLIEGVALVMLKAPLELSRRPRMSFAWYW